MKAEVIVGFWDKYDTTTCYAVGDVFEGSEERIIELADTGHVRPIEEAPKPKAKRTTRKRTPKE